MKQLHESLMQSSRGYANWHANPKHHHIHWGAVIIVAAFLGFLMLGSIKSWRDAVFNTVTLEFRERSSALALEPKSKDVNVGDVFPVEIILDSQDKPVDGVDVYALHYDPTILTVVDDNTTRTGVQITPGNVMEINAVNNVDSKTGTIKFSQAASGGTSFTGKGTLATIHFKAVAKGSTYLKFDFTLGNTRDTNVAFAGRDQLANVVDGLYTVK
jgi:hypothetical protein